MAHGTPIPIPIAPDCDPFSPPLDSYAHCESNHLTQFGVLEVTMPLDALLLTYFEFGIITIDDLVSVLTSFDEPSNLTLYIIVLTISILDFASLLFLGWFRAHRRKVHRIREDQVFEYEAREAKLSALATEVGRLQKLQKNSQKISSRRASAGESKAETIAAAYEQREELDRTIKLAVQSLRAAKASAYTYTYTYHKDAEEVRSASVEGHVLSTKQALELDAADARGFGRSIGLANLHQDMEAQKYGGLTDRGSAWRDTDTEIMRLGTTSGGLEVARRLSKRKAVRAAVVQCAVDSLNGLTSELACEVSAEALREASRASPRPSVSIRQHQLKSEPLPMKVNTTVESDPAESAVVEERKSCSLSSTDSGERRDLSRPAFQTTEDTSVPDASAPNDVSDVKLQLTEIQQSTTASQAATLTSVACPRIPQWSPPSSPRASAELRHDDEPRLQRPAMMDSTESTNDSGDVGSHLSPPASPPEAKAEAGGHANKAACIADASLAGLAAERAAVHARALAVKAAAQERLARAAAAMQAAEEKRAAAACAAENAVTHVVQASAARQHRIHLRSLSSVQGIRDPLKMPSSPDPPMKPVTNRVCAPLLQSEEPQASTGVHTCAPSVLANTGNLAPNLPAPAEPSSLSGCATVLVVPPPSRSAALPVTAASPPPQAGIAPSRLEESDVSAVLHSVPMTAACPVAQDEPRSSASQPPSVTAAESTKRNESRQRRRIASRPRGSRLLTFIMQNTIIGRATRRARRICQNVSDTVRAEHTVVRALLPQQDERAISPPQLLQLFWSGVVIELLLISAVHSPSCDVNGYRRDRARSSAATVTQDAQATIGPASTACDMSLFDLQAIEAVPLLIESAITAAVTAVIMAVCLVVFRWGNRRVESERSFLMHAALLFRASRRGVVRRYRSTCAQLCCCIYPYRAQTAPEQPSKQSFDATLQLGWCGQPCNAAGKPKWLAEAVSRASTGDGSTFAQIAYSSSHVDASLDNEPVKALNRASSEEPGPLRSLGTPQCVSPTARLAASSLLMKQETQQKSTGTDGSKSSSASAATRSRTPPWARRLSKCSRPSAYSESRISQTSSSPIGQLSFNSALPPSPPRSPPSEGADSSAQGGSAPLTAVSSSSLAAGPSDPAPGCAPDQPPAQRLLSGEDAAAGRGREHACSSMLAPPERTATGALPPAPSLPVPGQFVTSRVRASQIRVGQLLSSGPSQPQRVSSKEKPGVPSASLATADQTANSKVGTWNDAVNGQFVTSRVRAPQIRAGELLSKRTSAKEGAGMLSVPHGQGAEDKSGTRSEALEGKLAFDSVALVSMRSAAQLKSKAARLAAQARMTRAAAAVTMAEKRMAVATMTAEAAVQKMTEAQRMRENAPLPAPRAPYVYRSPSMPAVVIPDSAPQSSVESQEPASADGPVDASVRTVSGVEQPESPSKDQLQKRPSARRLVVTPSSQRILPPSEGCVRTPETSRRRPDVERSAPQLGDDAGAVGLKARAAHSTPTEKLDSLSAIVRVAKRRYDDTPKSWLSDRVVRRRTCLAWSFNAAVYAIAALLSLTNASKYGPYSTNEMLTGWLLAIGYIYLIIEPLEIIVTVCLPRLCDRQTNAGDCCLKLWLCLGEICRP